MVDGGEAGGATTSAGLMPQRFYAILRLTQSKVSKPAQK
jgi:hypothetical protein